MNNQEKELNYVYTEEARRILPVYQEFFKGKLEEYVKTDKYTFGDDIVEITASDVVKVLNIFKIKLTPYSITKRKNDLYSYITAIYFIIGLFSVMFGLFFNSIIEIFYNQPERATAILIGFILMTGSYTLWLFRKKRESDRKDYINRYYFTHKSKTERELE